MKAPVLFLALVAVPSLGAAAPDIDAGKAKVQAVCAACHGAAGVSVSESIPNLAGQRAGYIVGQLKSLKSGERKSQIMNPIASQLSPDEMSNVAAYFASVMGATPGTKSEFLPNVALTHISFPEGYERTFRKYVTMNFPDRPEVRYFYANPVALQAAREGKPLPNGAMLFAEVYSPKLDADKKPITGSDGFYVPDQLKGYTAMARGDGWGSAVPDMLRNGDWNYAVFTPAKQHRPGVNQAECFACHKPLENVSYLFTASQLAEVAKRP
ncbi:MAG: cytochrome P460 family protein [Usitatibacter sp.]